MTLPRPADFDEFWEDVLRQTAAIPLAPEVVADPMRSTAEVSVFQIFFTSLDHIRIAGWYSLPAKFAGTLPALLTLPGYQSDPGIPSEWARRGCAVLNVAARGKLRSNRQFDPGIPNLLTHNIVDRHTYAYRGLYADACRGVDFLLSRPEVDPARIGMYGSSQSGGPTVVTSALRPEIRAASAGAPFLCGVDEAIRLTDAYPYQEINDYIAAYPGSRDAVMETLAYFDGMNFAGRVACPLIMNVGLRDNICPPDTGRAVFEAIGTSDKVFYPYPDQGHDAGAHLHGRIVAEFFACRLQNSEAA